jgi:O-antigen/teichoic acid export membrane protein
VTRRSTRLGFSATEGVGRLGSLTATLGAGSAVQLLAAVAGFVAVPLQINALGPSTFGVLIVVASLAPWLTLIDGALYPSMRLLVGESRQRGDAFTAPHVLLRSASRLALKIAAGNLATLAVAVLVLPLVSIFGSRGVSDRGELAVAILAFALPVIASGPGVVYLGALEGVGRTVVATIFVGLGPLTALPLTALCVAAGAGLVPLCGVQGLAVALPRLCAWVYWHLRPSLGEKDATDVPVLRMSLVWQMVLLSTANVIQAGLDPVIVSSQLGARDAGAFGLANRIVMGALIPLVVLMPLFAANLAAARGTGWSADRSRELRKLVLQAGAAGLLVGLCVVVLGPLLAGVLGSHKVAVPWALYAAGGSFVCATFLSMPLYLAFSGPSGLARSVRLNGVLVVVNVALSFWLVHAWGPSGPLWASAFAGFGAVLFWLLTWRRHPDWLGEVHARGPEQSSGQLG